MTAHTATTGVLDRAWDISPRVSIRPESFGALLYHFGTRRLSFLKDPQLLVVVRGLADASSARAACAAAGLAPNQLGPYERALAVLAETRMIEEVP